MKIHEKYINRCLILAKKGLGTTRPNPMVGCVIVHDNQILGEGFTSPYGGPHAEVNAINQVDNQLLLKSSTLYVSLEPCSHHGKTPPCTDLILKSGIKKVVIGCLDPFEAVNGKGIQLLEKAGCEVIVGVLEEKCKRLNRRFFTFHQKKRPYIILKWAESNDGFIDKKRKKGDEVQPNWISNVQARQMTHQWRAEEQAVLVGTNTVINDDPKLNVRNWTGEDPIKLIIDKALKLPKTADVFAGKSKTILFSEKALGSQGMLEVVSIDYAKSVPQQICQYLYDNNIQSIIIEGGAITLQGFIDENLWDEAQIFKGPVIFKDGVKAPDIKGELTHSQKIIDNSLSIFRNA